MNTKIIGILLVVGLMLTFGAATTVSAWYGAWCRDTNYPTSSDRFCCADGSSGAGCHVDISGCYVDFGTASYGNDCYNNFYPSSGRFRADATDGGSCNDCPTGGNTKAKAYATSTSCYCSAS